MKTYLPLLLTATFLTSCSLFQDNSSIDNQELKNKKTIEEDIKRVKQLPEIVHSLFNRRKEICPNIASCNITSDTQLDKLVRLSQSTEQLSSEISKRLSYYQDGEKSMAEVKIMVAYFANLSSLEATCTIAWIIILNTIKKIQL